MKRRPNRTFLSTSLVLGALVLLGAIVVGNRLGDRVISQVTERTQPLPTPVVPTPVPVPSEAPQVWKSAQVTSVATDPAFPDPRVTPPPPPRPLPTPTPRPTPSPTPYVDRMYVPAPAPPVPVPAPVQTGPARGPLPLDRQTTPVPPTPYFATPAVPNY